MAYSIYLQYLSHKLLLIRVSLIPFLYNYFGVSTKRRFPIFLHHFHTIDMKPHCNKPKLLWILIVAPGSVWALQHPQIYLISNASAMYKKECWKWKPRALLAFVDLAHFSKNPGGYRKTLLSGSPRKYHRTFGVCRIRELFSTYSPKKELCFCLPESAWPEKHGECDSIVWAIGSRWWRMVRERENRERARTGKEQNSLEKLEERLSWERNFWRAAGTMNSLPRRCKPVIQRSGPWNWEDYEAGPQQ